MNIHPLIATVFMVIMSIATGLGAVAYVSMVGDSMMLISALPFVLAMVVLLIVDKRKLVFLILLFRASGDLIFESSKFAGGFGIGGLINALIIFLAFLFFIERPSGLTRRQISIWGGVLLVALAATLYAPIWRDALRMLLGLMSYCAVFVIAFYLVRSKADFESCVTTILLSSLIPFFYAFYEIALKFGPEFRLMSTFSHPNIFAFYLVLNIALLFYRIKSGLSSTSQVWRWALLGYMLLLFPLLLLTQTRSAWAACLVIFGVYGLMFERRYLLYLMVMGVISLLVPSVRDRLLDLGQGNQYVQYAKLNSFAWRVLLWEHALEWMRPQNYLFGYGLNSFKFYSPTFFPLAGGTHFGAHSTYVQWFFETGIIGVLASAWMYCRLLFTLAKGAVYDRLGTAIVVMLVIGYLFFAFSDNMLDYLAFNWYFWFFIGAACALVMVQQQDARQQAEAVDTESDTNFTKEQAHA